MRFNDPTLYGRDDETDEYSDSGGYGESREEDLEEEEEEEEEPVLVEDDEIPVAPAQEPVRAPVPVTPSGGGGSPGGPPKKAPAKKPPAKKKAAKKPAKKKAAKKPARKKPAAKKKAKKKSPKRPAKKKAAKKAPKKTARKKSRRRKRLTPSDRNDGRKCAALSGLPLSHLFSVGHDCVRFDFQQHLRRNQGRDRHHGARGTNLAKKLAVAFSDFFPIRNVGEEHASADDIFQ